MKQLKDIIIMTQARLNSERVPKKMVRWIGHSSLWGIACSKIKQLENKGYNCMVAVGHDPLKTIATQYNINNIWWRSKKSLSADVGLSTIYEWWNKIPYKYCVLINPCLPFLSLNTIEDFIKSYQNSSSEGMFGVIPRKDYFWNKNLEMVTKLDDDILNTKTVETSYQAAHALYGSRLDLVGQQKWMGDFTKDNPALYIMDEKECLDVDYEYQFEMIKILWEKGWKP